ncbi:hypothetical protein CH063_15219 [Colletotrichum higginsianum]|uniref:Uncharacterized protein n=1 Tax=Colletotrichum higginsianum (strain IMI 349063) TaxID=759273 RepID=H1W1X3_COLHI|nr:hypothetical protein CH063_15219 [Colletotrichum higginsianum]
MAVCASAATPVPAYALARSSASSVPLGGAPFFATVNAISAAYCSPPNSARFDQPCGKWGYSMMSVWIWVMTSSSVLVSPSFVMAPSTSPM